MKCKVTLLLVAMLAMAGAAHADMISHFSDNFNTATGEPYLTSIGYTEPGGSHAFVNDSGWWSASYFVGGVFPTDQYFVNTFGGGTTEVSRVLSDTYVAGRTYTLEFDMFGAGNYGSNTGNICWAGALMNGAADLASDSYFSDEAAALAPADHIVTVSADANPVKHFSLSYTATVADEGQPIKFAFYRNAQPTGGTGYASYYGWYDNISVSSVPEPSSIALLFSSLLGMLVYVRSRRS